MKGTDMKKQKNNNKNNKKKFAKKIARKIIRSKPISVGNVSLACPAHAPKAGKYIDFQADFFVGKLVKLAFPVTDPLGNKTREHMWVANVNLANGQNGKQLKGQLNNKPYFKCAIKFGDTVWFDVSEIEDIDWLQNRFLK